MTTGSLPFSEATLTPLLTLVGTAICVLLLDMPRATWRFSAWVSLAGLVLTAVLTLIVTVSGQGDAIQGMLDLAGVSTLFTLLFCGVGAMTVLLDLGLGEGGDAKDGGRYALMLFTISGALTAAQSMHLLPLTIGLTIVHTATSALIGRRAAWRYMITHGIGLACFLFGVALLYGATGSLRMDVLAQKVNRQAALQTAFGTTNPLTMLGLGGIVGGLALWLGVVPFHTWLPGTYRKAQIVGKFLVSLTLPGSAIAALSRLGLSQSGRAFSLLAVMGSLSIVLGYLRALRSHQIVDTLTGILIAQSGTSTLALIVLPGATGATLMYILVSNALSLACLWAMVANVRREDERPLVLDDVAGLGRRRPWLAAVVTLCLFSLAGVPPLSGAISQLHLFVAIATQGHRWMIGLAMIGTTFAWLLAGRWTFTLWMRPPRDRSWIRSAPEIAVIAVTAAGGVLWLGLYAEATLSWMNALLITR